MEGARNLGIRIDPESKDFFPLYLVEVMEFAGAAGS